jgi:hypothetical protein
VDLEIGEVRTGTGYTPGRSESVWFRSVIMNSDCQSVHVAAVPLLKQSVPSANHPQRDDWSVTRAKQTNLATGWGGWKAQLGADTKLRKAERRPYLWPGLSTRSEFSLN